MRCGVLVLVVAGLAACRPPEAVDPVVPPLHDEAREVEALRRMHVDGARIPVGDAELARAIAALGDPWTRRYDASAAAALIADVTGTAAEGVGLPELLAIDLDARGEAFEVVAPQPDSAAAKAGLVAHDRIVSIGGEPASPSDYHAVMERLRARVGQTVHLQIERDGVRRDVDLVVEPLAPAQPVRTERDGDVLVVRFGPFGPASAPAFVEALAKERPSALRLDLRGHTGGQLEAVVAIAGALVGDTEAVELVYADRRESVTTTGPVRYDGAIEVLVDGGTASAAEVLTAMLQSSDRVRVGGTTTFGKCLAHGVQPLPDGGIVLVTTARLARRGAAPWCGVGLSFSR
jgi:carboxyl-terminal processing protease